MNKFLSAWLTMMTVGGLVLIAYFLAPFAEALHNESVNSRVDQTKRRCEHHKERIKLACNCPRSGNEKIQVKAMH